MAVHNRPVSLVFLQTVKPDAIFREIGEAHYGPFHSRTDRHLGVPNNSYLSASYQTRLLEHWRSPRVFAVDQCHVHRVMSNHFHIVD